RGIVMRRLAFVLASLLLVAALVFLSIGREGGAFIRALLANLAVVGWSSFVLPLRGLPRFEWFYRLRAWERDGRLYRALGVPWFRAVVRRGPLSIFNRALPAAWHAGNAALIERETRAAEAAHGIAFGIVLLLAAAALLRGEPERAAWLVALDIPMNLYPVLLQRDHRLRLAEALRSGDFERYDKPRES
ncbi:MAG TPA: hypothetical protein VFS09_03650, partial [Candidatus Eisenbacteria bacterium]|nr:hypothetical protein [Candidatus Eisenbacteria bacterium]